MRHSEIGEAVHLGVDKGLWRTYSARQVREGFVTSGSIVY